MFLRIVDVLKLVLVNILRMPLIFNKYLIYLFWYLIALLIIYNLLILKYL